MSTRDEVIARARELDNMMEWKPEALQGPGAFQGVEDKELADAIDVIWGHGFADEQAGSVTESPFVHAIRVGSFILWTDSNGFHSLSVHDTEENAEQLMIELAGEEE